MQLSDLTLSGQMSKGAGAAVAALRARAVEWDLSVTEVDGVLSILLYDGELRLIPALSGARLVIRAPERRLVQVIRDAASDILDAEGISIDWDRTDCGSLAPGLSLMRVVACGQPSPNFIRVRVQGEDASRFATGGLHFRLLFAPSGQTPVWPRINEKGRTDWATGADRLHRPVYTVADHGEDWLEFDIFRHAGSPTCDWATANPVGDTVGIMGPGGGWCPDTPNLFLFGDETALPAIRRLLALAKGDVCAFVRADVQDLGDLAADARVRVVADPLAVLADMSFPTDSHIWFAGHETGARAARADLAERGIAKRDFTAVAYWA